MNKTIISLLALLSIHSGISAQSDESDSRFKQLIPEIHGTVRAKYEYQPEINSSRFQVRNARFSMEGKVHTTVGYKLEIDLSDQGTIRMLDAYANIEPIKDTYFKIGQMRVPFTIDAHRSPHSQYFANRSFIAKQVGDVRDVGAAIGYKIKNVPIILEAGIFNGFGITEQKKWTKHINYSAKAQFFPYHNFNITLSSQKISPNNNKIYMHDIGSYIEFNNFHIEAEYLFKHYAHNKFKNVHAFNSFINYDIPLKKVFKKISLLGRYDMMTDHWDGETYTDETMSTIAISDYGRHRITAGTTLSISKPFKADIRINYEKYIYQKNAIKNESELDKICFEVMVRF